MNMPQVPGAGPIARLLPGHRAEDDARIRQAAWVARCVGRGEAAPLRPEDVTALAGVQRPSLNKVLKDLERDRLISIGYSAIDILDPGSLARLAR